MRPLLALLAALTAPLAAAAAPAFEYDRTKYMSPDEVKPGMKGFGRTVMRGTTIETFQFEVIGVMRNAYYAAQDVILVRCSGLNLEHSGIIGGMSGSPCYVVEDSGKTRMIGAVAYGWTFNKDPVCGVQPITQMLPITEVRAPREDSPGGAQPPSTVDKGQKQSSGAGIFLGDLLARHIDRPLDPACRFSIFNDVIRAAHPDPKPTAMPREQLRPLTMPVMVSGLHPRTMDFIREPFERYGLTPVVSGGVSGDVLATADQVRLEPGSALCIPFVTGDIMMEGLGTCTEVIGDRVLGFGHSMFGEGSVELPLATGSVHTVIASVMRSNKIGAALKTVGTLWGDENSGIFGITGRTPRTVPVEVVVNNERGRQTFKYDLVHQEVFTPMLLATVIMESVFSHSEPPREHTIRYTIETEFDEVGTYRTSNFTSMSGVFGLAFEASVPTSTLMNAPFGKSKVKQAKVEVTIEKGARSASIYQANLPRDTYRPGETVPVRIKWMHYLGDPLYTEATYTLKLPADLPDGTYDLTVGSASTHLQGLRTEKPHLFKVDSPADALRAMNLISSFPDNRLYLRLSLPDVGLAVEDLEMPRLPSFHQHILASSGRADVSAIREALVVEQETPFAVSGSKSFKIKVDRRAGQ